MRTIRIRGRIYTGRDWASSLIIRGGAVAAVDDDGSVADETIDLPIDAVLCPGIHGSHEHWLHCYFNAESPTASLAGCATPERIVDVIRMQMEAQPTGTLMFTRWNTGAVPQSALTLEALDAVTAERPVIVYDQSFHSAQANGAMMRLLEAQGLPQHAAGSKRGGYLTEEYAMFALGALTYDPERLGAMLERQQELLLSLGFTRIFDKGILGAELFWRLRDLYASERLVIPCEALVPVWMLGAPGIVEAPALPRFRLRGAKDFADGAFGARTAACGPYPYCGTESSGLLLRTPEQLLAGIERVRAAGLDYFGVHCIGPAAIEQYARVVETALERFGRGIGATLSFEHLECPEEDVISRIARLQRDGFAVEVNTNPTFASDLIDYAGTVHPRVLGRVNPYGDFAREGLVAHAGTDGIPDHDVWRSIARAVNRPDGNAAQQISVRDAFGLYADGELRVGSPATFIVVDRDFLSRPEVVEHVRVRQTWIGGRCVWSRVP